jgi:hypothetical protein
VVVDPYESDTSYIRPTPSDGTALLGQGEFSDADMKHRRYARLELDGFGAFNESQVYSHTVDLTVWPSVFLLHAGWEHFYEVLPTAIDHLDVFRAHVGANVLGPWVSFAELYALVGASVLHGETWTPAFDVGGDLRLYPHSPLMVGMTALASVYEIGPVLLDASTRLGVSIDRFEVAVGPRWLYQGVAQGFWGPSAMVAVRF